MNKQCIVDTSLFYSMKDSKTSNFQFSTFNFQFQLPPRPAFHSLFFLF